MSQPSDPPTPQPAVSRVGSLPGDGPGGLRARRDPARLAAATMLHHLARLPALRQTPEVAPLLDIDLPRLRRQLHGAHGDGMAGLPSEQRHALARLVVHAVDPCVCCVLVVDAAA